MVLKRLYDIKWQQQQCQNNDDNIRDNHINWIMPVICDDNNKQQQWHQWQYYSMMALTSSDDDMTVVTMVNDTHWW